MNKRIFSLVFALFMAITCLFGVGCQKPGEKLTDSKRYLTDLEFTKASLSATDKFGEKMSPMGYEKTDSERYVGLFYWMWISNTNYYYHDVFDCTKLMSTSEGQAAFWNIDSSNSEYQKLSQIGAFHFTNEPLYGYYNSSDPWVITKHMEQFILAGIDFIFLDTSNSYIYEFDVENAGIFDGTVKSPCYTLLDTMLELYNKGWDVPKVVFLTNNKSGERVSQIRENYYEFENGKYDDLWFRPEGDKPMIIGTTSENNNASDMWNTTSFQAVSSSDMEYFDVKETQWPNRAGKPNGFPWICNRTPQYYHEESQAISVSVAQHGNLGFTDMIPRSNRGYDYYSDTIEENWQQGKNFQNQWDTVFSNEAKGNPVKFVNVTGWNEWIGMKFDSLSNKAVMVDNFYGPYTRDIEMDKTTYQDTTALQLARNIRKYKYEPIGKYKWATKTINSFNDFNDVTSVYLDFEGDTVNRNYYSFDVKRGAPFYTDNSGRNDILSVKVIHDDINVYFMVTTKNDITAYESGDNWMNILIKTKDDNNNFGGYNYIVNRTHSGNSTSVEKCGGGWNWSSSGSTNIEILGNQMLVSVPLSALGLTKDNVQLEFKVADNVIKPSWFNEEDAEHDILHYYVTGDSAPLGRYSYSYGY